RDYNPKKVSIDAYNQPQTSLRGDLVSVPIRPLDRFRAGAKDWSEPPHVHFGLILSGDHLVNNLAYREQLHQLEPEAIGGEMEGAGLYAAAQRRKVDWLLVKAILTGPMVTKKIPTNYRRRIMQHASHFMS